MTVQLLCPKWISYLTSSKRSFAALGPASTTVSSPAPWAVHVRRFIASSAPPAIARSIDERLGD